MVLCIHHCLVKEHFNETESHYSSHVENYEGKRLDFSLTSLYCTNLQSTLSVCKNLCPSLLSPSFPFLLPLLFSTLIPLFFSLLFLHYPPASFISILLDPHLLRLSHLFFALLFISLIFFSPIQLSPFLLSC